MKTKKIASLAAASFLPLAVFAQTPVPPVPPAPPAAPAPPGLPGEHRDKGPKIPVTWLGVETSSVPNVVSEQLGLAKGFGLVIDYVVPEGPAAGAGVQQNDIVKMLNDQILMEPGQLAKLVRSFADGTTVTLTVLRKGAEQKISVKLAKHEVPQRGEFFGPRFEKHWKSDDFGKMGQEMERMKEQLGDEAHGMAHDAMATARMALRKAAGQIGGPGENPGVDQERGMARDAAEVARTALRKAAEQARRAGEDARRQTRQIRVVSTNDNGVVKSTSIDLGKAEVVMTDAQGELKIAGINGKKVLTAKDAQGKVLFSGPVDSKEDLDKVPGDVRQRYDQLQQKNLPGAIPSVVVKDEDEVEDVDVDQDDSDDNGNDDEDDNSAASYEQVSLSAPYYNQWRWMVLI